MSPIDHLQANLSKFLQICKSHKKNKNNNDNKQTLSTATFNSRGQKKEKKYMPPPGFEPTASWVELINIKKSMP